MRVWTAAVAAGLVLALAPAASAALPPAPGSLDRSFGTNGGVVTSLGAPDAGYFYPGRGVSSARAVVATFDGRLIAGGSAHDGAGHDAFALARYTADGRLDPTFGNGGVVVRQFGAGTDARSSIRALAVEPDGGVVAVGSAYQDRYLGAAARFDADGRLVWSAVHPVGPPDAYSDASAVLRQPDGRVVVGGSITPDGASSGAAALWRLNRQDGSLDTSFAGTGWIYEPDSDDASCCTGDSTRYSRGASVNALALTPAGAIVAGGGMLVGCGKARCFGPAFLRAYSQSGERDRDFATGPVGLAYITGLAVGRFPYDAIMAVGVLDTGLPAVAHYTASGALEPLAGDPGYRRLPGSADPSALVADSGEYSGDRFLTLVGRSVQRLLATGGTDETFVTDALPTSPVNAPGALALDPAGRIAVAGAHTEGPSQFALTRLAGGTLSGRVTVGATAAVHGPIAFIPMTCQSPPGAASCGGGLTITTVARRGGARRVTLGGKGYRTSYRPWTQPVRINRVGRRLLVRGHGRLVVRVRATNATARSTLRRVTLVAR